VEDSKGAVKGILFGRQEIEVTPEIWDIGLQWDKHGDGKVSRHYSTVKFFHKQVARLDRPVVIDAGACIGSYSIAAALHPGATVYAFEPNPRILPLLKKQIALNHLEDRITVLPYGLWHKEGEEMLLVHPRLARSGSATFGDHPHKNAWHKIPVATRKLDSFAELWPNGVHIIKLDVEGAERNVLRGGRRIIKRYLPALFMEHVNAHLFGYTKRDLVNLLKSWGYKNFDQKGIDIWVTA
jgi:FkbM family methyltransferase